MNFINRYSYYTLWIFILHCIMDVDSKCACLEIKPITPPAQHSEGPVWDEETNTLFYVDTFAHTVYKWQYYEDNNDNITSFRLEGRDSVGVIIPIKDKPNEYIVGADRYLYKFKWESNTKCPPHLEKLLIVDSDKPRNQYNDGKVDSKGRLWIGTLTRNPDKSVASNGGSLYMVTSKKGTMEYAVKITCTTISNGLAWSADNKQFFYIDSETKTVVAYDFDENTGNLGCQRTVFDLRDHPNLKGIPDGMTIDDSDNLWIALFGGHSIINVDPRTGLLKRVVKLPVTYVTSACFGGPQMNVLYVTTSKLHLNESQLNEEPLAGCVFAVSNLGVKGLPSTKFSLDGKCT